MNRFFKSKILIIFLIFIGVYLYFHSISYKGNLEKSATSSVYSGKANGTGIFYELASKINVEKVIVQKEAFLKKLDSNKNSAVFIFSPKLNLSEREAGILAQYVDEGGLLYISVASLEELSKIKNVLSKLSIDYEIEADLTYVDQSVKQVKLEDQSFSLFKNAQNLSIYSAHKFKSFSGDKDSVLKYTKHIEKEKGIVILQLGIPLISNALISKDDNRQIAFNILDLPGSIIIDEYRHFYTNRTISDLLYEPSFFLPFLGMLILVLVFLFFRDDDLSSKSTKLKANLLDKEFHTLNSEIFLGLWKSKKANYSIIDKLASDIANRFPEKRNEINNLYYNIEKEKIENDEKYFSRSFNNLIILHRSFLEEKGLIHKKE